VTTDFRYYTDFYASHVGNNDQYYRLQLGETGKQYLTLQWDQTPHLFSTTAQSLFGGSKTFLTAPDLSGPCVNGSGVTTNAQANICGAAIAANLHTINLGIQRDKGTVTYRSTPDDKTEFKVEYSHERRWGNQEQGITSGRLVAGGGVGPGGTNFQVPMPIADTTQDARASYQYTGTSPWGMRLTGNVQYGVSLFRNDFAFFDIQNPFLTSAIGNATPGYLNQFSLAPDNMAQSFTGTIGADLPGKSRYMGTFSYVMMRQNDPFMAQTSSPFIYGFGGAIVPSTTVPLPPRASLDGKVDTMLFNNVLTTQLNPDLKNKLTYRYYSYDNNTPRLLLSQWVIGDTANACFASNSYCPHATQFSSYIKQNAGEELTWRATNALTTGIAGGWERFERSLSNVNVTNEYSGKVFADSRPTDWLNVRTSYQYLVRRYENYDYKNFVWAAITNQFPGCVPNLTTNPVVGTCAGTGGLEINPLMRIFDLANRDRQKANVYVDFEVAKGLTITPTFGMQLDHYPGEAQFLPATASGNPPVPQPAKNVNTIGLKQDNDINGGVDITIPLANKVTFVGSYLRESINRSFDWATGVTASTPGVPGNLANYDTTKSRDLVDTFAATVKVELTNALDLKLGYVYSRAKETGAGVTCASLSTPNPPVAGTCSSVTNLAIANSVPTVFNTYQRLESTLNYKLDPDRLRAAGWQGQGYLKLRYVYETNHVSNWQSDNMMPYMFAVAPSATGGGNKVWMAGDNPNYNAQLIMATLGLTW
jgi:MtrB/PioB family decaheme-associated outer membrane protein